jgi:non-lysosomal glucosylceramidase
MACLVHLYLDWQLSGDLDQLRSLWPAARRSLEFCWIQGGWDADEDGVMEGVQHNTMDVEYYGPNPQMGSWYLAALRAAEEMARAVGEVDFADHCHRLFKNGSEWLDENLFNGKYYRHEVRPVSDTARIADGLRHRSMGAADTLRPDLQLADGCLVDQLVGEYAATLTGLGTLLDGDHVRSALLAIYERNFQRGFEHHFNPMRSFVLGDEAAVLMCSYDEGKRPERPFPYFGEVMTGFEYTAATGLLQVGETAKALEIIGAIRSRYDGNKRNPFDEAECGHHYARAMASWSAFATWNGISYSGVSGIMAIADRPASGTAFWSTGSAFGTWEPSGGGDVGCLKVIGGELLLNGLEITGRTYHPEKAVLAAGDVWNVN